MLLLLGVLAHAGATVYDFPDDQVEGELLRPDSSVVFQRNLDAPMGLTVAQKWVRRYRRRAPKTPAEKMQYADALQVVRQDEFVVLAAGLDAGVDVDFSGLDAFDVKSRELYLDAAPGLTDDHAARVLFLAARLADFLGLNPVPELETCLELDPRGAYAESARLMLAERAFAFARLEEAIDGYTAVRDDGGRMAEYATYKLAWCWFNLGRVAPAVDALVSLSSAEDGLGREARRDVVLFASVLDKPEALAVIQRACGTDQVCVEASELRLMEQWRRTGRLD